ncbi:hypothetical protein [Streptomyces sp. CRN 30]|uniref:hypothetical protein n=1 Tax=Streptomyces sp. CRN 30 TaxID=3075613 RepID=UPI002A805BCB|nr:hypothetical protein [Streptomyces sp. CRN 30]
MTTPADDPGIPLPVIPRPDHSDHPVLAAVLAELRVRDATEGTVVAYYEDAP